MATLAQSAPLSPAAGRRILKGAVVAGVLALSVHLHMLYIGLDRAFTWGGNETVLVARSLADRGEFADPYASLPTGPTAHVTPAWPVVLAVFHRLAGGNQGRQALYATVVCGICWGLCLLALPVLSRRLFGHSAPGSVAMALGLLPLVPMTPAWEAAPTAALLAWSAVAALSRSPAFLGFAAGVLALFNPIASLALFAFWGIRRRPGFREAAVFLGVTGLVLVPWTVRNRIVLGGFVPVRDAFGLAMDVAYRDGAKATHREMVLTERVPFLPSHSAVEARKVREMGELRYMNECTREVLGWIAAHPANALRLTGEHLLLWVFPYREGLVPVPWLTCALSLAGIAGLARARAGSLAALTAAYSVPYLFVQVMWRYATPVLWVVLLGAGWLGWRSCLWLCELQNRGARR